MKAVITRVTRARVEVQTGEESEGRERWETVGECGPGALILLGVMRGDGEVQVAKLSERIARFRFFPGEAGRMDRSLLDLSLEGRGGEVLVVSQFTLAADGRKGRRPSFDRAEAPAAAEPLYEGFVEGLRALGLKVETGQFGARMRVESVNDGPVTFVFDEPA